MAAAPKPAHFADVTNDAASAPVTTGATVTVGCKIEMGIRLHLERLEDREELTQNGSRTIKQGIRYGEDVLLRGPAMHVGTPYSKQIIGGYAFTHGVSLDFMEEWMRQNKGSPLLNPHNPLIIMQERPASLEAESKEKSAVRSGLEPLAIDGEGAMVDRRAPRAKVRGVEIAVAKG